MKIGILTFHRATNYGAVLQCYGLYVTLKKLGHDVEVIDYRPEYIEKYRRPVPYFDIRRKKGLSAKIKLYLISLLNMQSRKDSSKRFDLFLSKEFNFSPIVLSPCQIPNVYDVIIFGSDQIWSPQICFGFDEIYWGQFPHSNCRLITYAASIGGHNHFTDGEWRQVGNYIKVFEHLSVRELQLQNDLKNHLGINSELVVDPTILVGEEAFEKIAEKPKEMPENYVLVFSVAPTKNLMGFAKRVADQLGSDIVTLSAEKTPWFFRKEKTINVNPSVSEFLGWFKYAKCVITVSFHGTVFSVIFKKDFYSLSNYMQDRAENFLRSVGLIDRLVDSDFRTIEKLNYVSINYEGISERLKTIRKDSLRYLISCLNESPK